MEWIGRIPYWKEELMKRIIQEEKDKVMKTIDLKTVGSIALVLLLTCCEWPMDRKYLLYVSNQADHSIKVYINDDERYRAVYPDTVITNFPQRLGLLIVAKEEKPVAGGTATWKSNYEVGVPSDTLSMFIIHADTLARYGWETVRRDYKILKRYDLSLGDLERLNFSVPYPPTQQMRGMKMYPR